MSVNDAPDSDQPYVAVPADALGQLADALQAEDPDQDEGSER